LGQIVRVFLGIMIGIKKMFWIFFCKESQVSSILSFLLYASFLWPQQSLCLYIHFFFCSKFLIQTNNSHWFSVAGREHLEGMRVAWCWWKSLENGEEWGAFSQSSLLIKRHSLIPRCILYDMLWLLLMLFLKKFSFFQ